MCKTDAFSRCIRNGSRWSPGSDDRSYGAPLTPVQVLPLGLVMRDISFLVAFGAGLASFLTPCVLPMIPIYLANLSGSDVFTPQASRE